MTTPPVPSAESIESLRRVLRALVQEVCDYLKDVETPVREWTRVVREEGRTTFPNEQRKDLPALASHIFHQDILDKLPTFGCVVQFIRQDPALAEKLLVDVAGNPIDDTEGQYSWIKSCFIYPFLREYLDQSREVSFEDELFCILFRLISAEMQTAMATVNFVAPLINLRVPIGDVELDKELRLRNMSTDELERWINRGFELPIASYRLGEIYCAIELDFEHRWPSDMELSRMKDGIIEREETTGGVLNVLRLLTGADIFIAFSEERYQGLLWRHSYGMRWGPTYRLQRETFVLDANGAKRLKTLWQSLVDGPNKDKVKLALKRFGDTAERLSAEDKLIDYWIALESLFAPETSSEIRYRAALRIASYLGGGEERTKIHKDIGLSYDFRSAVVHGNRKQLANLERRKATLSDITERTRGYLRRALLKILESDEVFDPRNIEHELLSG